MATDNFCFYLHNRLIQTSQTGGQQYSDTSPFSIPCLFYWKYKSTLRCVYTSDAGFAISLNDSILIEDDDDDANLMR
jgi:hypothetical protein